MSYEVPGSSTFTVAPPTIKGTGDEFGCPRRMTVEIEPPGRGSDIRFTIDGSTPKLASERYHQPLAFVIPREKVTLTVRAISVDSCGAVSAVTDAKFGCSGTYMTTPAVSHWFDFPFPWPGKKPYDDVVFEGAQLPLGCSVANDIHAVSVKLLSETCTNDPNAPCETGPPYGEATDGHSGVAVTEYSINSRRLQLKLRSWHLFGFAVRYQVSYSVTGNNCALPAFSYRTE